MNTLYQELCFSKKQGRKKFAVLVDPDKLRLSKVEELLTLGIEYEVDYFFIGGSLVVNDMLDSVLQKFKDRCEIPLVLFPGNSFQLSYKADALLFLSLISGRNAELLIGKHVITAPFLKISPLEIISTGYMLIDGGISSTVQYMSNTAPIPREKDDIALCTAVAGELLGLKQIYMDAGSGAKYPISPEMVNAVASAIEIPLIIGGGLTSATQVKERYEAGADLIVVGNALEQDPSLLKNMIKARNACNQQPV